MKRIIGTVFAIFLTLVLFFVLVPVMILPTLVTGQKISEVPSLAILELDLGRTFTDQPHSSSFGASADRVPSIIRLVETLARAETDIRVAGLFVTLPDGTPLTVAQGEEIRDALESFRASGKFVITHAQGFETKSPGAWYAASNSDELWMSPEGTLAQTDPEALSEVALSGSQAEDYSSTIRTFTRSVLSDSDRDTQGSLLQTINHRAIAGIAASRGMNLASLQALLEEGSKAAPEALKIGLITHLGRVEEARDAAFIKAGEGVESLAWGEYLAAAGTPYGEGDVIAVVYAEGAIKSDHSQSDDAPVINAEVTANAIRDAADSESVRAILFRIDSSGGSAIASGQIWDAVKYARDSGKPVVVSMGGVAASGGYYVAMAADRIIAQPSTITGSIGVVDGKFIVGRSYGTIGLTVSDVVAGAPVDQVPSSSEEEEGGSADESWQSVNKVLGNFYTDFTLKVAEERGMSLEAVHDVADGRIWSGAQARDLGLIDDLGGFRYAIDETRSMIGLDADAPVELRIWPGPASPWQRIMQMRGVSGSAARVVMMFSQLGQVETIKDLMASVYTGALPDGDPDEADPAEVE